MKVIKYISKAKQLYESYYVCVLFDTLNCTRASKASYEFYDFQNDCTNFKREMRQILALGNCSRVLIKK